ncbi:MAG TPA: apolipoprotein N-acyltransferase [Azospirillaceae bacterium]|nr:apolipoprotein N-acyltransferase [Azospirillaceae bacterium]
MTALTADAPSRPAPLRALAARAAGLAGWRRYAAAAAAGGLATLALPPAYAAPLLWLAFPWLVWQLDGAATRRQAFWLGWSFAFGHFLLGLYWVAFALTVDLARFGWLLPFAMAGLPALLAAFVGAATLGYRAAVRRFGLAGPAKPLAFAVAWTLAEYARGHLFTGFPWNLTGYAWTAWTPVMQAAAFVGVYGLTLLTVAAASLPALLGDPGARRPGAAVLAGVALFGLVAAGGAVRLAGADGATVPGVTLRLVQAAIPQSLKWDPELRVRHLEKHMRLSLLGDAKGVTHVVWPETAVPFAMDAELRGVLSRVVPPGGLLLTGIQRVGHGADGRRAYFNAMEAVDAAGAQAALFDKFHLVPFGEYMPLRRFLPAGAVGAVAAGSADFSAGPGPRTVELPGLPPVSPLICYEVIFPATVTAAEGPRPGWLLNLTNDAWYGETAGPHQHFAIARMRAVEEGLPLVRSANTGISGVVDAHGRVVGSLGLGEEGVVDLPLPVALPGGTVYGRLGDLPMVLVLLCVTAMVGFLARRM